MSMMQSRSNFRIACLCDDVPYVEHAISRLKDLSGQYAINLLRIPDTSVTCFIDVVGVDPQDIDGKPIDLLLEDLLNDEIIEWKMRRVGATYILYDDGEEETDEDAYVSEFCDERFDGTWTPFMGVRDKVKMPFHVPESWRYYNTE